MALDPWYGTHGQRMCFDAVKTYEQNLEEHRRKVKEEGKDGEYKKLL